MAKSDRYEPSSDRSERKYVILTTISRAFYTIEKGSSGYSRRLAAFDDLRLFQMPRGGLFVGMGN
jgi:hypothetical protein